MNALDTNVLLRFIINDDPPQNARAARLIEATFAAGETLYLSDVVLCEAVWVLERAYRYSRQQIIDVLRQVLCAQYIRFRDPAALGRALDAFTARRGDFADYVIREHARAAGCEKVHTFDRALAHDEGFAAV
jgi:predicted nucleic-acid-binding protein